MGSTPPKEVHCKKQIRASGSKDIDSTTKSTVKIKLVPRGQQNRLHQNEDTRQGKQVKISASRSTKSASPKRGHPKRETKSCLEVNEIDFTKRRTPKREEKSCLEVNEINFTKRRTL